MQKISRRSLFGLGALVGLHATGGVLAKQPPRAQPSTPATIHRSESFAIPFRDRLLRISIAKPLEVDPNIKLMIRGRKPVPVYVLDSMTNFPLAASTARLMQWGGEAPPCLVIGVGYDDEERAQREEWRSRELSPTASAGASSPTWQGQFGGAPEFRCFLVETLRPLIERRFDVDRAKGVLVGHSLGGMFTIDTMAQMPDAFGNYLAISPSLWWEDELVLHRMKATIDSGTRFNSRVAVFAGEQEERISRPASHMTSNTLEFGRLVADHRDRFPNGALVRILPECTHHTVVGAAMAKGLRFLIAPEERRTETF